MSRLKNVLSAVLSIVMLVGVFPISIVPTGAELPLAASTASSTVDVNCVHSYDGYDTVDSERIQFVIQ